LSNPTAPDTKVILVLDGERLRHGFATAVQARLWAFFRGVKVPVIVAIDSQGSRDIDLRNARSRPAAWRPMISGRADKFDRFLIDEIVPQVPGYAAKPRIYIFGHSLAGLYTVEFAIRHQRDQRFGGFAAFAPTLSHDTTVLERLPGLCASTTPVLATIGWESKREHALFDSAKAALLSNPRCSGSKVSLDSSPGMLHQLVMLTGQAQAIRSIVLD
jgi:predicted alpha/beta superfamily hydrolase